MEQRQNNIETYYAAYKALSFIATSVAAAGLIRRGNYSAALHLYAHGGGGLNIFKHQANGKLKRCFAIDYHPFWDQTKQQSEWKLHYHRGKTAKELKNHRPYQGGW